MERSTIIARLGLVYFTAAVLIFLNEGMYIFASLYGTAGMLNAHYLSTKIKKQ